MDHIFQSNIYSDRDPDQNMVQMNSLFLNLISTSATADCQSMPLKQFFGDFYTKARFSVENTFDKFLSSAPIELRPAKIFERFVDTRPYADIMQYRAEIPEGLIVTYLDYLKVLMPAQESANNIVKDVIDPFTSFVSKMISDEIFRNQAGHQIKEFAKLEPEYVHVNKEFAKCFGKNDFRASASFGEVVKRNGDWHSVFAETEKLRKAYQAFPAQELTKKLNRLYEMLDELVDQIKLDHYAQVEKEVTQLLGNGMYFVAKMVELAALTTFRSRTFIESINTTIKNVEALPNVKG
ncbi:hypothetical protein AVU38_gp051 [Ralstonia phage RSL2]|uniref:Uncharacterized protein n=1 Tax=Ralstonia phage RSL2 TaxID=1585840 RepID=A0A0A8J9B9_9CAUD|nr:hypothetical protein AVU38_gp051 [Ralstonia phage RSL2]BAQ02579.1 hypothetical protein [Ralstonia phage RSL2]